MRKDENPSGGNAPVVRPGDRPADPHIDRRNDPPSKSQRKRDMTALQQLGVRLVACKPDQLARLNLPESLRDAIIAAQRIHAHEGLRRQLQYIGRLMRASDTEAIQAAYEAMFPGSRSGRRRRKS